MGADLYNRRRVPQEAQKEMNAIRDVMDSLNKDDPYRVTLANRWNDQYDIVYGDPLHYFRDSYNGTNLLWQLGLSWWQDVIPLQVDLGEDADNNMDAEGCRQLLNMIQSRAALFAQNMAEFQLPEGADGSVAEWREYFIKKHKELVTFLEQAEKDGGFYASL